MVLSVMKLYDEEKLVIGRDLAPRGTTVCSSSTKVFQRLHSGHFPIHFGTAQPHSWQRNIDFVLVDFIIKIRKILQNSRTKNLNKQPVLDFGSPITTFGDDSKTFVIP